MGVLTPRQRRLRRDARMVFGTRQGKRLFRWMMRRFHVLGSTFDENPTKAAFNEGERNAILELLELASISVDDLEFIYREARLQDASGDRGVE